MNEAPGAPAVTCTRCGVFFTSGESVHFIKGKAYCAACVNRPDVDYLEAFRLEHWGKRDAWTWLVALGIPSALFRIPTLLQHQRFDALLTQGLSLACSVAFVLGKRWARWAMLIMFHVQIGVVWFGPSATRTPSLGFVAGVAAVGTVLWVYVLQSTRNKLFFKIEVSRSELEQAWDLYENNPLARSGFVLGLLSLAAWPLGVVALPLSIVGLSRVNPHATPPMGRRGQAIAGIVCSSLGVLATLLAVAVSLA